MFWTSKLRQYGLLNNHLTIKDKIRHHKALIDLHVREKKMLALDMQRNQRVHQYDFKIVRQQIHNLRLEYNKVTNEDSQFFVRVLNEHQRLRKAFSMKPPHRLIEYLLGKNFSIRKRIDQYRFKREMSMQKLKLLLEQKSNTNDLEIISLNFYVKKKENKVADKIQTTIIRKNMAVSLSTLYKNLIKKLKKDAQYYNPVLDSLRKDALELTKCIITATEMGQMSFESLDVKKTHYTIVSKAIDRNLTIRTETFQKVQLTHTRLNNLFAHVISTHEHSKFLEQSSQEQFETLVKPGDEILDEINALSLRVNHIKDKMPVESSADILKCLGDQLISRKFLINQVRMLTKMRNFLRASLTHAKYKLTTVHNYGQDSEILNKLKVSFLNQQIKESVLKQNEIYVSYGLKGGLYLKTFICIILIADCMSLIALPPEDDKEGTSLGASLDAEPINPIKVSYGVDFILDIIKDKLKVLLKAYERLNPNDCEVLQKPLKYKEIKFADDHEILNENGEDVASDIDFETEDSTIPTYTSMKLQSSNIVISALVQGHRYLS